MGETRLTLDIEQSTFFEALDPIGKRVAVDKISEFEMHVGDVFFCRPTSLVAVAGSVAYPLYHPVQQEKVTQKDR